MPFSPHQINIFSIWCGNPSLFFAAPDRASAVQKILRLGVGRTPAQGRDNGAQLCAAWGEGAKPQDVEHIRQAMAYRPANYAGGPDGGPHRRRYRLGDPYRHRPPEPPKAATKVGI